MAIMAGASSIDHPESPDLKAANPTKAETGSPSGR